jgi:hypothetical protein
MERRFDPLMQPEDEETLKEIERFQAAQQYIHQRNMMNSLAGARQQGLIEGLREEGLTDEMINEALLRDLPRAQQKAKKIGRKEARELGRLYRRGQMASGVSSQLQRPSSVAGSTRSQLEQIKAESRGSDADLDRMLKTILPDNDPLLRFSR